MIDESTRRELIIAGQKKMMTLTQSMFKTSYTLSRSIIETFNQVSPVPLNVDSAFPALCMYFSSKILCTDKAISSEELSFLSTFFGTNISSEAVEACVSQDNAWIGFFEISCALDNRLKQLGNKDSSTTGILYSFFENYGIVLLNQFETPKGIEAYNHIMSELCKYINKKNDALKTPLVFRRYTNPLWNLTPASSEQRTHSKADQPSTHANYEKSMSELNQLIGLQSIKRDVSQLIGLAKMMKMREEKGMKNIPVSLHLVFTGNPGTGKTTVARILAELYKEIGILKKGQLIEVDRSELVAGYIGQTAIKTQEKINEAIGGILFIDEAYTLVKEGNDFGQEAIDTILKEMEDHRGEFIVIVAGYSAPMKRFIDSNPGLKSRFSKYFDFPDYSADELIQIFCSLCSKYEYTIEKDALDSAKEQIRQMELNKGANFANARDIRNMFEKIITKQSNRVAFMENATDTDMTTITLDDVRE